MPTRVAPVIAAVICLVSAPAVSAQSVPTVTSVIQTVAADFRRVVSVESGVIVGSAAAVAATLVPREGGIVRLATLADGMDDAFNAAPPLGHGLTQVGGSLALFVAGRLTHQPAAAELGAHLMRAHAVSGAMTHAIKVSVRRLRPDGGRYSFPSGHTSAAFATATVLQRDLGWKAGMTAYLVASYIGASRAAANKHYVSDVVVGAALGVVSGRAVTKRLRATSTLSIAPLVRLRTAGVVLTWTPPF